jgi:RNase P subunit RPR2
MIKERTIKETFCDRCNEVIDYEPHSTVNLRGTLHELEIDLCDECAVGLIVEFLDRPLDEEGYF